MSDPRRSPAVQALMRAIDGHPTKDPTMGQMVDAVLAAVDEQLHEQRREWGVMFADGSVRHCWNGRTAEKRAREEREHLEEVYAPDKFRMVSRRVWAGDWTEES